MVVRQNLVIEEDGEMSAGEISSMRQNFAIKKEGK
jgi:hypothetical protein